MIMRVLLVDDDPRILDAAQDVLQNAGYETLAVASSKDALNALQRQRWHVLIADLNLPDGDGLNLALAGRSLQPSMRIALMSGQSHGAEPAGLQARQDAVVDDYLVKPVSPPQLLRVIQRLLG